MLGWYVEYEENGTITSRVKMSKERAKLYYNAESSYYRGTKVTMRLVKVDIFGNRKVKATTAF